MLGPIDRANDRGRGPLSVCEMDLRRSLYWHTRRGSGGAEAAASEIGVPFLGRLPLSPAIRTASDAGNPPAAGEGAEAKAFADLAQRVVETLETVRR